MPKRALVTGVNGQDGAYLAQFLLHKGYQVYGGARSSSNTTYARLMELGIEEEIEIIPFDMRELPQMLRTIERIAPDEVYNLAAQSFVEVSWHQPLETIEVNGTGVCRLLEALRGLGGQVRFYQASTSELFGNATQAPQSETTPFRPRSPYGVAKLCGHCMTVNYRESFGLHASCGILFNHESPLRGTEFVTRKISLGLARIAHGGRDPVKLGNLSAQRDWGFAGDYVCGMWDMLQQENPDDYVLATGRTHTVRAFVEQAAASLGIDLCWEGQGVDEVGTDRRTGCTVVVVDPAFRRPAEVYCLVGDASKAKQKLRWEPRVSMEELAAMMTSADYDRVGTNRVKF